jgi:hypothetical protein
LGFFNEKSHLKHIKSGFLAAKEFYMPKKKAFASTWSEWVFLTPADMEKLMCSVR